MAGSLIKVTDPNANEAYRFYAPARSAKPTSYAACLDQLGFKPEQRASKARTAFLSELRAYVDTSCHKFLRKRDNEPAFKTVVAEFLKKYGLTYWGHTRRGHLDESDASRGFLYPRDAERPSSRLVETLEAMFNYKATTNYRNQVGHTRIAP